MTYIIIIVTFAVLVLTILFLLSRIAALKSLNKQYWEQWHLFEAEAAYFHKKYINRLTPEEQNKLEEYIRAGAKGAKLYNQFK